MKNFFERIGVITSSRLILLVALFIMAFGNMAFFSNVTNAYPVNLKTLPFLGSLAIVFGGAIVLLLSLVCSRRTIKPVLIAALLTAAAAAYFMDSYNVVINESMLQNITHTDVAEASDLITVKLMLYIIFLGILPSVYVYKVTIAPADTRTALRARARLFALTLVLAVSMIMLFGNFYASFFREHKALRYYANPSYSIYSAVKYANGFIRHEPHSVAPIGLDARIPANDTHRELIIFVLGETARADRFSLNGYAKPTNPLLMKEGVLSFSNIWACGTSTAVSVPCMFSNLGQSGYSDKKARATENVLDVLKHAGVNVLWLDNNSDSKGVALRVPYESYKTADKNPVCDVECRDEGMLADVQAYINGHPRGDIFIVLHQMGNHGPAYYKRYPASFEKFTPACKTNQLEKCSKEEIDNAYDNAILYTDYFLSQVIAMLKRHSAGFESAMFYISDHGESLGERGVYLHGLPGIIAPDTQRRVPGIMWFGKGFDEVDIKSLAAKRDRKYTHDNIFHTVLGFMEIETSVYDREMDIVHGTR